MNISQTAFRRIFIFVQLVLIAFVSASAITAQSSSVDVSFNAVISKERDDSGNLVQPNFTLQPDGKILTYGSFQVVNGELRRKIARLNPDGSLDNSFDCATCDFNIESAIVQSDGKIITAGTRFSTSFSDDVLSTTAGIQRLNPDGSPDSSFVTPFATQNPVGVFSTATVWAVQPDGKILVSVRNSSPNFTQYSLYRLNADGTFDSSFQIINLPGSRTLFSFITKVLLQPDGKILISGGSGGLRGYGFINRYDSDGTRDADFESPNLSNNGGFSTTVVSDMELQPDGKIVFVGQFSEVNGIGRKNIARLFPAGNLDLSFDPQINSEINERSVGVELYPNGKVLVSISTSSGSRFVRLNSDGSSDDTFTSPDNLLSISQFLVDGSDGVLFYGSFRENGTTVNKFARLNADGSTASSFGVNFGTGGSVRTLAIQPDGGIIIGGDFSQVNGVSRGNIARLKSDGSLDLSFDPGTGFNTTVEKVLIQADGRILVGGRFTSYNGMEKNALVRLNLDGSLDTAFNADVLSGSVLTIDLQSNGSKILIGGSFNVVGRQTRNGFARLNSDGSLDAGFNPIFGNPQFATVNITRIIVQENGKIAVGGSFSGVNGFSRMNLIRFNADGTLDTTFNAGNIGSVAIFELYPNGKYIVSSASGFVRLNNDGTIDNTFQTPTPNGAVNAISVQPDGSIIIGGGFTSLGIIPRMRLARLRADGTVDTSFFPVGADDAVRVIVRQSDGKLFVGGDFSMIAGVTRLGIARLIVTPVRAQVTPFDFDGDGRSDIAVFRPSSGVWYELRSRNNSFYALQFGISTDKPAPADYDGDGITDIAVFRQSPLEAGDKSAFYITDSSNGVFRPVQFGSPGDVPVSGDWDGDGIADLAVYRNAASAGGQSYFFYRPSSEPGADFRAIAWGTRGDAPVRGDFDGDGKLDAAVFRAANATWYILQSSNNQVTEQAFGIGTDVPVPADYDGDGKTNLAVYRRSNGYWYIARAAGVPSRNFEAVQFGSAEDVPVAADYDGDGRADIAVYRPAGGVWYLLQTSAGFTGVQFGVAEDKPIPHSYIY